MITDSLTHPRDEQGRFAITEVPEGEYVLVANQDGKPGSREPFPKIFYPSVREGEHAAVINIAPGQSVANPDIVIPKLEEPLFFERLKRSNGGARG